MDNDAALGELGRKLPFYRAWVTNAIISKRHDKELIAELTRVKADWGGVTDYYHETIEKFDRPGLREGREHILETMREGEKYCGDLCSVLECIIVRLTAF